MASTPYFYYSSYQCYWGGGLRLTPTTLPSSAIGVVASLSPVLLGWWPPPYSSFSSYQCYWGGCLLIPSAIGVAASSLFQLLLQPVLLGGGLPSAIGVVVYSLFLLLLYPVLFGGSYWGGGILLIPVAPPTSSIGVGRCPTPYFYYSSCQ